LVRRFVTIALSLSLVLGLTGTAHPFAQGDAKKDAKPEAKKDEAPKPAETKKDEAPKPAETKAVEPSQTIPPEVEAKLEAARKAVAEAIVAAQDAGLVHTTVDPPPILDILITGRATDVNAVKSQTGVSPEVFGAWFTGFGKLEGYSPEKDVRIVNPSAGLRSWYDQRATMLTRHIEAVRKEKGNAARAKEDEAKKKADEEAKKKEESKKDEKSE
jgi:hypothetical protein